MNSTHASARQAGRSGLTRRSVLFILPGKTWAHWHANTGVTATGRCRCCGATRARSAGARRSRPCLWHSLILLTLLFSFFKGHCGFLIGVLGAYSLVLFLAGVHLAIRQKRLFLCLGVPLSIACMHFSWGAGFLWGLFRPQNTNKG
jgi:hypothetical protein